MRRLFVLFFVNMFIGVSAYSATTPINMDHFISRYNLNRYLSNTRIKNNLKTIKIAILDNGFSSLEPITEYLPSSTKLVEFYPEDMIQQFNLNPKFKGNPLSNSRHGLMMAQIIWGLIGESERYSPQFYLLNANGITNFKRAVRYSIENDIDIILYSHNWNSTGNFDGQGFINQIVNQATEKDIFWINAAGNYGGEVANIQLNDEVNFTTRLDETKAEVTLSWCDATEKQEEQPQSDLDLYLYDENKNIVAIAQKIQVGEAPENDISKYARETITITLNKGNYSLKPVLKAGSLPPLCNLRIHVKSTPDNIRLENTNLSHEIMIPADNPNVITLGDLSPKSSHGPTMDGRTKPDFLLTDSTIQFSNGIETKGTSNAAAIYAGLLTLLLADDPSLEKNDLISTPKQTPPHYIYENREEALRSPSFPKKLFWSLDDLTEDFKVFQQNQRLIVELPFPPQKIHERLNLIKGSDHPHFTESHFNYYYLRLNSQKSGPEVISYIVPQHLSPPISSPWLELVGPHNRYNQTVPKLWTMPPPSY